MPETLVLDDPRKQQLDKNIRSMLEKGASQDDVMAYASDFKSKYGVKKKEPTKMEPTTESSLGSTSLGSGENKDIVPSLTNALNVKPDFGTQVQKAKDIRKVGRKNSDGTESTVKFTSFEEDGKYMVIPTLFPKDPSKYGSNPNDWVELPFEKALNVARKRGEIFEFKTDAEAKAFAEGAWKESQNTEQFKYIDPAKYDEIYDRTPEPLYAKSQANKPVSKPKDFGIVPYSELTQPQTPKRNSREDLFKSLANIDKELIGKEEEFVVPELNNQFGDHGFKFEETGIGDAVSVTAPNGQTTTINLDPFTSSTENKESVKLQDFIMANMREETKLSKLSKAAQNQDAYNKKFLDQKEIDQSFTVLSEDANKVSQDIKTYTQNVELLRNAKAKLAFYPENEKGSQEYKDLQNYILEKEQFVDRESVRLENSQYSFETNKRKLDQSVGKYVGMKAQQGTFTGGLINSVVKEGFDKTIYGYNATMIDGMFWLSDAEKKEAKKKVSKMTTYEDLLGDPNTTEEYSQNAGLLQRNIYGLAAFAPAILAGGAGLPIMYAQISGGVDKEMLENPAFENISENEKLLVKTPLAVAAVVLMKMGITNSMLQKGVLNDVIISALGKTSQNATAKTLEGLLETEVKSAIVKGLIRTGAGAVAGAEAGIAMHVGDVAIKDIYNAAKGKKMFQTPDSVGEYFSELGTATLDMAIGGAILGGISSISKAYKGNDFNKVDDATIETFSALANDSKVLDAMETDLQMRVNNGELTIEEAQKQMSDFREAGGVLNSIDTEGFTPDQKKRAMTVAKKLRDLKKAKEGKLNKTEADKIQIETLENILNSITDEAKTNKTETTTEAETESETKEADVLTKPVSELVDKKVEFDGKEGVIRQDEGGKLTFETEDTVIELNEGETALEIVPDKIEVSGNEVTIGKEKFEFISTNTDKNGRVVSVTLKNEKGKVITKRDAELALDIGTEMVKAKGNEIAVPTPVSELPVEVAEPVKPVEEVISKPVTETKPTVVPEKPTPKPKTPSKKSPPKEIISEPKKPTEVDYEVPIAEETFVEKPVSPEKEIARKELDTAKEAFMKKIRGDLSSGGFHALPEFANLVKAYIKYGVVTAKDFIKQFREDFPDVEIDEVEVTKAFHKVIGGNERTGVTHELTDAVAREFGVEEYEKVAQTEAGWELEADKIIAKDKNAVQKIFAKLEKGGVPTGAEVKVMQRHIASLNARLRTDMSNELLDEFKKAKDLYDVAAGHDVAIALRSRQGAIEVEDSLGDLLLAKKESSGVDELTDKQKETVGKMFDELQEAKRRSDEKLAEANKKNDELQAQIELNKRIRETRRTNRNVTKEKLDSEFDDLTKQFSQVARGTLSSGLNPELVSLVGKMVTNRISKGIVNLSEVIDEIHDKVKDHLSKEQINEIIAGKHTPQRKTRGELEIIRAELKTEAALISKLEALERGEVPKTEAKKISHNQKLKELRDKIKDSDVKKLADIKSRNEQAIKKINEKIVNKDYEPAERKQSALDNPEFRKKYPELYREALDSLIEKEDRKAAFELDKWNDLRSKRKAWRKVIDFGRAAIGLSRAIVSSIDNSVIGVQLGFALINPMNIRHTGSVLKAQALDVVSKKRFDRELARLHNSEWWPLMRDSGLDILDPASLRREKHDEAFSDNPLHKDYIINGKKYNFNILAPFERLFTSAGNKLRELMFVTKAQDLMENGKTFESHPQEFKDIASVINTMTARTKLPSKVQNAAEIISPVIWSPKMIGSALNILGISDAARVLGLSSGYYSKMQGGGWKSPRAYAIKQTVGGITMGYAIGMAVVMSGGSFDDDPRSVTFGTIQFQKGGDRIRVFGRLTPYVRLIAMGMTGEKVKNGKVEVLGEKYGGSTKGGETLKFLRGKTTPFAGTFIDWYTGKMYDGKPFTYEQAGKNLVTPMTIRETMKALDQNGMSGIITRGIPSFFGFNISNEKDFEKAFNSSKADKETKAEMKKWNPQLYKELYGPGSMHYQIEQEEKRLKKEIEAMQPKEFK